MQVPLQHWLSFLQNEPDGKHVFGGTEEGSSLVRRRGRDRLRLPEDCRGGGPPRRRFLHGPFWAGALLRLDTDLARRQHALMKARLGNHRGDGLTRRVSLTGYQRVTAWARTLVKRKPIFPQVQSSHLSGDAGRS